MRLALKNLLFTVIVPGTVAGAVPWLLASKLEVPPIAALVAAAPFWLAGISVYLWCLWDFAAFGGGTPAPIDAPKRLVVRGLYRYVRNPMYVGVLLVLLGWTTLHRSSLLAAYTGAVALGFHIFIVLYEEPALGNRFGDSYETYRSRVGRWIPRIPSGEP